MRPLHVEYSSTNFDKSLIFVKAECNRIRSADGTVHTCETDPSSLRDSQWQKPKPSTANRHTRTLVSAWSRMRGFLNLSWACLWQRTAWVSTQLHQIKQQVNFRFQCEILDVIVACVQMKWITFQTTFFLPRMHTCLFSETLHAGPQ